MILLGILFTFYLQSFMILLGILFTFYFQSFMILLGILFTFYLQSLHDPPRYSIHILSLIPSWSSKVFYSHFTFNPFMILQGILILIHCTFYPQGRILEFTGWANLEFFSPFSVMLLLMGFVSRQIIWMFSDLRDFWCKDFPTKKCILS